MNARETIGRELIVAAARRWIGTPYLHQASLIHVGCDCLGLVRGVWREIVGPEPEAFEPYTPDWAEATGLERLAAAGERHFTPVALNAVAPGDVVLFRWRTEAPAKHCAIVTEPGAMVHAHDGASVCEVALSPWWRRRMAFAFSFPDPLS
ncbi:MAG: NlpC/P60 family protein [Hyphomicrobiales bacterium]|nr:NlpC/P60 family protein [Hyphomicrobiales bacterium]